VAPDVGEHQAAPDLPIVPEVGETASDRSIALRIAV